jgi:hypothetical protein
LIRYVIENKQNISSAQNDNKPGDTKAEAAGQKNGLATPFDFVDDDPVKIPLKAPVTPLPMVDGAADTSRANSPTMDTSSSNKLKLKIKVPPV